MLSALPVPAGGDRHVPRLRTRPSLGHPRHPSGGSRGGCRDELRAADRHEPHLRHRPLLRRGGRLRPRLLPSRPLRGLRASRRGAAPAYFASAESPGSWWHFHNEGDYRARGVAASGLDAFREAVEAAGGEFRTGTYPAKDHNAWDAAWSEDALWDWVFSKALADGHTGPSGTTPPNAPVRAGRPLVVCTASRPGRDWTTGPERAADGLDGTTYMPDRSVGRGEWLQAEFPDGVSGRIAVLTGITEDGRRRHRLREGHLEVSPDGEAWESVGSFSPETGECEAALPGTVRFVRVVTDNATPKKIAIRRFVVTP